MSVTKSGAEWYGRNVVMREDVLYSCILGTVRAHSGNQRAGGLPESPYKPLHSFDSRHEPQLPPDQAQERLYGLVQLGILGGSHLRAVLILALLAEKRLLVRQEPSIEAAQLFETLMADVVDGLETLAGGNFWLENQGLCVRGLLRLHVKGALGVDGNLRQLRGER